MTLKENIMIYIFNEDQAKGVLMEVAGEVEIVIGKIFGDNETVEKGRALYEEGYDIKALGDMQAAIEKAVGEKIY